MWNWFHHIEQQYLYIYIYDASFRHSSFNLRKEHIISSPRWETTSSTSCSNSRHFLLTSDRGMASDLFVDAELDGLTSIGLDVGLMDHLDLLTASVPLTIDVMTDIGHLPRRVNRKDRDFHFHLVIMAGDTIDASHLGTMGFQGAVVDLK